MFAVCGVAANDFKTVCSSIDKLDKVDWATVREELIKEKNVPAEVADRLEQYVRIRGLLVIFWGFFINRVGVIFVSCLLFVIVGENVLSKKTDFISVILKFT